jgi:mraW methylase family
VEDNDPMAAIYGQKRSEIEVVNRKPILPGDAEIAENPRARSAKMRILQRR